MSAIAGLLNVGRGLVKTIPTLAKNITTGVGYLSSGKKIVEQCCLEATKCGLLAGKIQRLVNNPFIAAGVVLVNKALKSHEEFKNHKVAQLTVKTCEDLVDPKSSVTAVVLKTIFTASCILIAAPEGVQAAGLVAVSGLIELAAPKIDSLIQHFCG